MFMHTSYLQKLYNVISSYCSLWISMYISYETKKHLIIRFLPLSDHQASGSKCVCLTGDMYCCAPLQKHSSSIVSKSCVNKSRDLQGIVNRQEVQEQLIHCSSQCSFPRTTYRWTICTKKKEVDTMRILGQASWHLEPPSRSLRQRW